MPLHARREVKVLHVSSRLADGRGAGGRELATRRTTVALEDDESVGRIQFPACVGAVGRQAKFSYSPPEGETCSGGARNDTPVNTDAGRTYYLVWQRGEAFGGRGVGRRWGGKSTERARAAIGLQAQNRAAPAPRASR